MPAPENVPAWVYIVVTVVLPVLGWISKDWRDKAQTKVQDVISVRGTQGDLITGLQKRVAELEQRLDGKDKHYQGLLDDMERRYLQHISTLESHIESLKAEIKGYQDSGTPGAQ